MQAGFIYGYFKTNNIQLDQLQKRGLQVSKTVYANNENSDLGNDEGIVLAIFSIDTAFESYSVQATHKKQRIILISVINNLQCF